jgi:prefoldin subunit 5
MARTVVGRLEELESKIKQLERLIAGLDKEIHAIRAEIKTKSA